VPDNVGVIADAGTMTCPNGAPIRFEMDNEDYSESSTHHGWIGGGETTIHRNSVFLFCRVPGTKFKPLSTLGDTLTSYAVLKLDASCPPGSMEFRRLFDNEDSNTANRVSGSMWPNGWDSNGNTSLYFCLFSAGATTMSVFPDLGISYGVFAQKNFVFARKTGVTTSTMSPTTTLTRSLVPPRPSPQPRRS
jgi:hypothetical protein